MRRVGRHSEELPHTGDLELWLRLGLFGPVCRIDADQAYKRLHAVNMQYAYIEPVLGDLRHRKAAFEVLFRDHGERIAERRRLERLVSRALGMQAFWAASTAFDGGDLALSQQLLDFARGLDPELPTRPEWRRLVVKRRLGPRAWRVVRPVADFVRKSVRARARAASHSAGLPSRAD